MALAGVSIARVDFKPIPLNPASVQSEKLILFSVGRQAAFITKSPTNSATEPESHSRVGSALQSLLFQQQYPDYATNQHELTPTPTPTL